MPGAPMCGPRRWPTPLVLFAALLLMGIGASCERSLAGAPCPCASGWECCQSTATCFPESQRLLCADHRDGGDSGADAAEAARSDTGAGALPDGDGAGGGDAVVDAVADANGQTGDHKPGDRPSSGDDRDGNPDRDSAPEDNADAASPNQDAAMGVGAAGGGGGTGGAGGASSGAMDASIDGDRADDPMDPAPPNVPGFCTAEGWCWTHPLPTGDSFTRAFGIGGEVWVTSAAGTIARFKRDGTWSAVPSPMPSVHTLWGLSTEDVWAGGDQGVYRWNGASWNPSPVGTGPSARAVREIWGCSAQDVWAVGGVLGHWKQDAWDYPTVPEPTGGYFPRALETVWGSGCTEVWAGATSPTTRKGTILRWDGNGWFPAADIPAQKIVGTASDNVWSLAHGALSRWNGAAWVPVPQDRTVWDLFPVGAGQIGILNDARAVLLFTGLMPVLLGTAAPPKVTSIFGRAADDLWGVGAAGTVARWTGSRWDAVLQPWSLSSGSGTRITGSSATDLWAVVGGVLLQGDGATWRTARTAEQTGGRIHDVWARAANDVWVLAGDGAIQRWTGQWNIEHLPPAGGAHAELRAISGTGPKDVWLIRGPNTVLHNDGNGWVARQPLQTESLTDIWAVSPDDAWVVGDGVWRWSTDGWTRVKVPPEVANIPFHAVGGGGGSVFFLAGGYVLRANPDGESISVVLSGGSAHSAIHVVARDDAWLVVQDPNLSRVYRIASAGTAGVAFNPYSLAPAGMNDIWAAPDGAVWMAGEGGALLRKLAQ